MDTYRVEPENSSNWPEDRLIRIEIPDDGLSMYRALEASEKGIKHEKILTDEEARALRRKLSLHVVKEFNKEDKIAIKRIQKFENSIGQRPARYYMNVMNSDEVIRGEKGNIGSRTEVRAYADMNNRHVRIRVFPKNEKRKLRNSLKRAVLHVYSRNKEKADQEEPLFLDSNEAGDQFDALYRKIIPRPPLAVSNKLTNSSLRRVLNDNEERPDWTIVQSVPTSSTEDESKENVGRKRGVKRKRNVVASPEKDIESSGSSEPTQGPSDTSSSKKPKNLPGIKKDTKTNDEIVKEMREAQKGVVLEKADVSDFPTNLVKVIVKRDHLCGSRSTDISLFKKKEGIQRSKESYQIAHNGVSKKLVEKAVKLNESWARKRVLDFLTHANVRKDPVIKTYLDTMKCEEDVRGIAGNFWGFAELKVIADTRKRNILIRKSSPDPDYFWIRSIDRIGADRQDPIFLEWDGEHHFDAMYRPEHESFESAAESTIVCSDPQSSNEMQHMENGMPQASETTDTDIITKSQDSAPSKGVRKGGQGRINRSIENVDHVELDPNELLFTENQLDGTTSNVIGPQKVTSKRSLKAINSNIPIKRMKRSKHNDTDSTESVVVKEGTHPKTRTKRKASIPIDESGLELDISDASPLKPPRKSQYVDESDYDEELCDLFPEDDHIFFDRALSSEVEEDDEQGQKQGNQEQEYMKDTANPEDAASDPLPPIPEGIHKDAIRKFKHGRLVIIAVNVFGLSKWNLEWVKNLGAQCHVLCLSETWERDPNVKYGTNDFWRYVLGLKDGQEASQTSFEKYFTKDQVVNLLGEGWKGYSSGIGPTEKILRKGVAIYVRDFIPHYLIEGQPLNRCKDFDARIIGIRLEDDDLNIFSIYFPTSMHVPDKKQYINVISSRILSKGDNNILVGDWNINPYAVHHKSIYLHARKAFNESGYHFQDIRQNPKGPTGGTHSKGGFLDHCLSTNHLSKETNIQFEFGSPDYQFTDHRYLKCVLGEKGKMNESLHPDEAQFESNDAKISCWVCGIKVMKRSMHYHMRIHIGSRPYQCKLCGRSFLNISALYVHTKVHSEERSEVCTVCNARFKTRNVLNAHMIMHSKVVRFRCGECDKGFKRKQNFTIHMNTHYGLRPFKCDFCGSTFTQRSGLTAHKKLHVIGFPFNCEECGEKFKVKRYLQKHINKYH